MQKYDIAAYIWPAYTGDEPRTRMFWPEGMGEWQSVKNAVSKYEGHSWPRRPLWGYVNEADPYVMEMEINAAADHGVNVFIYDWYWYDDRPFLEQCLDNGFLKASNNDRMKFYIMWANHDANNYWDKRLSSDNGDTIIWRGAVTEDQFKKIATRTIEKYFKHPLYYKIDNKPVYMIYDIGNLVNGLGGMENTRRLLDWFRNEAVKAGFDDIDLQLTMWSENAVNLSGVDGSRDYTPGEFIEKLGFDSMTHYQQAHFNWKSDDYVEIIDIIQSEWEKMQAYDIPYYPHVSLGWDNNPRFNKTVYPVIKNNTPENVEKLFRAAKDFCDRTCDNKLITVNSWNEWTETSYLEPDTLYGYGYLEAIKRVFVDEV